MLNSSRLRALSRRSLYAVPLLAINGLFTDVTAISLAVAVGPPAAALVHWLVLAPWACLMLWALQHHILPDAVEVWVERQEARLGARMQRFLRWGRRPAILALAATLGPLSALIGIRVFGFAAPLRYIVAIQAAAVYCLVWTDLVYGGGWLLLQALIGEWYRLAG